MSFTAEELEARRHRLGASEVPAVLSISPFAGPQDIFLSKLGLAAVEETLAMQLGNHLELPIATFYAKREKVEIASFGTVVHPSLPWLAATPDFAVACCRRRLLQVKLVGGWMGKHWGPEEAGAEGVPPYVQAQVQTEMECADADECDVAALIGGTDFRSYRVERDRGFFAAIREVCESFWFDCVLARQHPDIDGSDATTRMLSLIYRRANDVAIVAPREAEEWAVRLHRARIDEAQAKKERALAENQIKALMGEATVCESEWWKAVWRPTKDGKRPFKFSEINAGEDEAAA